MTVPCLVCAENLEVAEKTKVGDLVDCENCGVELEVLSKEPIAVAIFEEEEK